MNGLAALSACFDQARGFENAHVFDDGGAADPEAFFDAIEGQVPGREQIENHPARGIGDGFEEAIGIGRTPGGFWGGTEHLPRIYVTFWLRVNGILPDDWIRRRSSTGGSFFYTDFTDGTAG